MSALAAAPIDFRSLALDPGTLVAGLRAGISGRVIAPGDPEYEAARLTRTTGLDRRPIAIVRPADEGDVARAVIAVRSAGAELAVRGGGHSVAGHGTIDGGVVLDLSSLARVEIDPVARIGSAGGGTTAGAFTIAAHAHGLVAPLGDTRTVGIAGLTLGGGVGFLVRRHGMTIDRLVAADVVTADGELVTASEERNPDLFWALRGGGGNFGVATRLSYRLAPLATITGGALVYAATAENLLALVGAADAAPDDLSMIAMIMACPPLPMVPAAVHGTLAILAVFVHSGDPADAAAAYAPFRALAPLADLVGAMPFPAIYDMTRGGEGAIHREVVRSTFRETFDEATAAAVIAHMNDRVAPTAMAQIRVLGGAMGRVAPDATAFAHRGSRFLVAAMTAFEGDAAPHAAWTDAFLAAIAPERPATYVNFLGDEGQAGVRAAYPTATLERLVQVKRRWDPSNVFRSTHNVRPL